MKSATPLPTLGLALEPLAASHAEAVFEYFKDAQLYTYIPRDPPQSLDQLRERFAKLVAHEFSDGNEHWLNWVGRETGSGNYVGMFEATVRPGSHAHIAYSIFVPFQGQGYGREGVKAVIDQLFQAYDIPKVLAEIDTRNRPSINLVERLGFRLVHEKKSADFFKGQTSDEFLYVMTREMWQDLCP